MNERNSILAGAIGLLAAAALLLAMLNIGAVTRWFTDTEYSGTFTDATGLRAGDPVRLAGIDVGRVEETALSTGEVQVRFTLRRGIAVGRDTRLAIKSKDLLGSMYLQVIPAGPDQLPTGTTIPASRTRPAYAMNTALADLATTTGQIDTERLAAALDALSTAFADTAPGLRSTIHGVGSLSDTISTRDTQLRQLLAHLRGVTGVLDQRKAHLLNLFRAGNLLLEHLNERRRVVDELIRRTNDTAQQLSGLVDDNRAQSGPVLAELHRTVDNLNRQSENLNRTIAGLTRNATQLGEAVNSGPYFQGWVVNVAPTNLIPVLSPLLGKAQR